MRAVVALVVLSSVGCWNEPSSYWPQYDAGPSRAPASTTPPAATSDPGDYNPPPQSAPEAPPSTPFAPVVAAAKRPPPLSGGTLTIARDGVTAIASDPDRDRLSIVTLSEGATPKTVRFATGDEPGRSAEDASGRVHVVLRGAGAVAVVDLATATELSRRPVCPAPRGVAYDPIGDHVVVACAGGELVALAASTGAIKWSRLIEDDLRDVLIRGSKLHVTRFRAAEVLELTREGLPLKKQATPILPGPVKATWPALAITAPGGGDKAFAPNVAWRAVGIDGGVLVLHQRSYTGPVGSVITEAPVYYGSSACETVVQSTISYLRDDGTPTIAGASLNGAIVPVDFAATSSGKTVAVLSPGGAHNDRFPSLLLFTDDRYRDARNGCIGTTLSSFQPRGEPIAIAFDARFRIVVQSRQPAQLEIISIENLAGLATKTYVPLGGADVTDTGHALFHVSGNSAVACASCHPEGSDDGLTWDFVKGGKRRTQDLRGGFLATAPFHWSGDVPDMNALMKDVFEGRMQGFVTSNEQRAALAKWLDATAHPAKASPPSEAVARGAAQFAGETLGCATCHTGPRFTSTTPKDVGTGGSFDVPSLTGVTFHAPYLHDGCAAGLKDVFVGCGKSGAHARAALLPAAQLDDLLAYMRSL